MLDEAVLTAIGHPVRLRALVLFETTPSSAGELGKVVGMSTSATLHHIRRLEAVGLIEVADTRRRRACEEHVWRTKSAGWIAVQELLSRMTEDHEHS